MIIKTDMNSTSKPTQEPKVVEFTINSSNWDSDSKTVEISFSDDNIYFLNDIQSYVSLSSDNSTDAKNAFFTSNISIKNLEVNKITFSCESVPTEDINMILYYGISTILANNNYTKDDIETFTIEDTNTTYDLSIEGSELSLNGSDDSTSSVTIVTQDDLTALGTSLGNALNSVANTFSSQISNLDSAKSDTDHTHRLESDTITGVLPVSKGGTGRGVGYSSGDLLVASAENYADILVPTGLDPTTTTWYLGDNGSGGAEWKYPVTVVEENNTGLITSGGVYDNLKGYLPLSGGSMNTNASINMSGSTSEILFTNGGYLTYLNSEELYTSNIETYSINTNETYENNYNWSITSAGLATFTTGTNISGFTFTKSEGTNYTEYHIIIDGSSDDSNIHIGSVDTMTIEANILDIYGGDINNIASINNANGTWNITSTGVGTFNSISTGNLTTTNTLTIQDPDSSEYIKLDSSGTIKINGGTLTTITTTSIDCTEGFTINNLYTDAIHPSDENITIYGTDITLSADADVTISTLNTTINNSSGNWSITAKGAAVFSSITTPYFYTAQSANSYTAFKTTILSVDSDDDTGWKITAEGEATFDTINVENTIQDSNGENWSIDKNGTAIFGNTVTVSRDPAVDLEVATKQYVDANNVCFANVNIFDTSSYLGVNISNDVDEDGDGVEYIIESLEDFTFSDSTKFANISITKSQYSILISNKHIYIYLPYRMTTNGDICIRFINASATINYINCVAYYSVLYSNNLINSCEVIEPGYYEVYLTGDYYNNTSNIYEVIFKEANTYNYITKKDEFIASSLVLLRFTCNHSGSDISIDITYDDALITSLDFVDTSDSAVTSVTKNILYPCYFTGSELMLLDGVYTG